MKFSCILIAKKEEHVMYVNGGCVMATVSIYKSYLSMEKTL
jgi:hypothetical protein